jgi:hypothetical protein
MRRLAPVAEAALAQREFSKRPKTNHRPLLTGFVPSEKKVAVCASGVKETGAKMPVVLSISSCVTILKTKEELMGENKGKPSGSVAQTKKDAGKQGDIKHIGETAGAKKKKLSDDAGLMAVAGGHPRKK